MASEFPVRSGARLLFLLAGACSTLATLAAAAPAALAPDVPGLFLDGLEGGDDCRWSAAEPPEPGTCSDAIQNGCETDFDCGGRTCAACGFGLTCLEDGDCLSGICYQGSCDTSYLLSVVHGEGGEVTSSPAGIDCGATCSALFDAGTLVTLTATPAGDAVFLGWSGPCQLDTTCAVTVDQAATVTAHFGYSVTVTVAGTGTVTSTPNAIQCGATCTGAFESGTVVTLAARTANGSNAHFSAWSDACAAAGSFHDCQLTVAAPQTVTATFSPRNWNLAFVSSVPISPTLGSAEAYDVECNLLASAAGINNVAGTGYIGWTSSSTSDARTRLGDTRGWVKLDGSPFADSPVDFLDSSEIFHALDLDEHGARHGRERVMTGGWYTGRFASLQQNCRDWTRFSGWLLAGFTTFGPISWAQYSEVPCTEPYRIYCLGTTRNVPLTPAVTAGKRIWVSGNLFAPNPTTTPDDVCAADQPGALAVIARTTLPASAVIDPGSTYVRMDGQVVGTGAEILSGERLLSGVWQHHDGSYFDLYYGTTSVWTGANGPLTETGTTEETCGDWVGLPESVWGRAGYGSSTDYTWWNGAYVLCDVQPQFLYCVEP